MKTACLLQKNGAIFNVYVFDSLSDYRWRTTVCVIVKFGNYQHFY